MLKNSSTLAVSVPISISIKFGFESVNGPREIYFMDTPRTFYNITFIKETFTKETPLDAIYCMLLHMDTAICRVGDMHSENAQDHTVVCLLLWR